MKKTRVMLLLLALALALGALPAQAAEKPLTMEFTGPVTLTEGKSAVVLKTKVNSTESGVISYKLVDNVDKNKPVVFEQTVENVKGGDAVAWTAPYYAADMSNSKPTKQLRATFTMDGNAEIAVARELGIGELSFVSRIGYGGGAACAVVKWSSGCIARSARCASTKAPPKCRS